MFYPKTRAKPSKDPAIQAQRANERFRRYRERHPDRTKAAWQRWANKNRDAIRQKAKARYAADPSAQVQAVMRSRAKHIDGYRAYSRMFTQCRRALELNAPGTFTVEDYEQRAAMWGGRCYLGLPGCEGEASQIEHVIPLSRGGTNWPANLRPACKICNRKKNAHPWRDVLVRAEEVRIVKALLIVAFALVACAHVPQDPCANVKPGDACVRLQSVKVNAGVP